MSVGASIALAIDWRVALLVFATFFVVAVLSKKVSLGSICAALMITVGSVLFAVPEPKLVLAIFAMCMVIMRHYDNILRLLNGVEPDFKPAGKKKKAE